MVAASAGAFPANEALRARGKPYFRNAEYVGRSHLEIAQILTRNLSFAKLQEEWKRVGKLLGFSFEEYRKIWRGESSVQKAD